MQTQLIKKCWKVKDRNYLKNAMSNSDEANKIL